MLPPLPPHTSPTPLGTAVTERQGPGGPSTMPCQDAWHPREGKVLAPPWAPLLAPHGAGESSHFGLGQGGSGAVPGPVTTHPPRRRSSQQAPSTRTVCQVCRFTEECRAGSSWPVSGPVGAVPVATPRHGTGRRWCRAREGTVACACPTLASAWPRSSPTRSAWPGLARGPGRCPTPRGAVPRPAGGCQPWLQGVRGLCLHKPFPLPPACLPACLLHASARAAAHPSCPCPPVPLPAGAPHHPRKGGKSGVL